MNNNKQNILLVLVFAIFVTMAFSVFQPKAGNGLQGSVISAINTWRSGTTNATTTINTTSTQVLSFNNASTTKWGRITNPTTATITCSLDDLGVTAASSSVGTSKGIIIGPQQANASSTAIPAYADFGECNTGDTYCIPFEGTVNCLASAAATVSVVRK